MQPVRQGPIGALSTVYTEGQTEAHWSTVYCTYRGHWLPAGVGGRLGTDGIDTQTDREHTHWGTLGHCQLYIQRAQTTSQTGGTQWSTVNLHLEGKDNQSFKGHTVWHTGAVNCAFRGHRQPVRQSNLCYVYTEMLKVKCSFGP